MASSRILIIGGTGYIGKHIAKASLALGHPTFLLVRESTTSNPQKAQLLESFKTSGANIVRVRIIKLNLLVSCVSLSVMGMLMFLEN